MFHVGTRQTGKTRALILEAANVDECIDSHVSFEDFIISNLDDKAFYSKEAQILLSEFIDNKEDASYVDRLLTTRCDKLKYVSKTAQLNKIRREASIAKNYIVGIRGLYLCNLNLQKLLIFLLLYRFV